MISNEPRLNKHFFVTYYTGEIMYYSAVVSCQSQSLSKISKFSVFLVMTFLRQQNFFGNMAGVLKMVLTNIFSTLIM